MKLYYYNKKNLTYKSVTLILSVLLIISGGIGYMSGYLQKCPKPKPIEYDELVVLLNNSEKDRFTPKAFYDYLCSLKVKFPKIVFAQSKLECNFNSNIFRTNNNLFGMKLAGQRPTTAIGVDLEHAVYKNWKESVLDYALFQSRYLSDLKTEEQYLDYLSKNYSETVNYMERLNNVINSIDKYTKQTK